VKILLAHLDTPITIFLLHWLFLMLKTLNMEASCNLEKGHSLSCCVRWVHFYRILGM